MGTRLIMRNMRFLTGRSNFRAAEFEQSGDLMHFALASFVTPLGESLARRHATNMIVEDEAGAQQGALAG